MAIIGPARECNKWGGERKQLQVLHSELCSSKFSFGRSVAGEALCRAGRHLQESIASRSMCSLVAY